MSRDNLCEYASRCREYQAIFERKKYFDSNTSEIYIGRENDELQLEEICYHPTQRVFQTCYKRFKEDLK